MVEPALMDREKALAHAIEWATRAENAAQEYPHIGSANATLMHQATGMADMWTALSRELDDDYPRLEPLPPL